MKIYPYKANGQPVDILGEPVSVQAMEIEVSCQGNKHKLSLVEGRVIIHNHSPADIEAQEYFAQLAGSAGAAIECVRIKLWLKDGIGIL
jgi:hypothetical protein